MNKTSINIVVTRIKDCLDNATKPMTASEIAKELEVVPHTVRNHIDTAIKMQFARETPFKVGKAKTYESTSKKTNFLPAVAMPDGKIALIRDFFIKWTTNTVTDPLTLRTANIVIALYAAIAKFSNLDDKMSPAEQAHTLKSIRSMANKRRDEFRSALAIIEGILDNDNLWTPKDLFKYLVILDDDMDLEMIRSYLDRTGKDND